MKKIFTLSSICLLAVIFLSSCVKDRVVVQNDENYWLTKEQGQVVYVETTCDYWVVETYNGYNVVYSNPGNKPYEGDIVYGNFSNVGTRDMYNYTGRFVFTGSVTDYWLSYNQALDVLDYYCPLYGKSAQSRVFKESTIFIKK